MDGFALIFGLSSLMFLHAPPQPELKSNGLAGYISMDVTPPPKDFTYGVSIYTSAWPLVSKPIRDFQIGLASIWIVPDNRTVEYSLLPTGTVARDNWPERGPSYRDVFQTIEGGLGFWGSTRFASATAKFRMNGTANGYNHEISSPGWGFGDTKSLKPEQMGIAQLSSRILVPPDGLTFRSGTCGDLLGYAWMALPFTEAKTQTAGLPVSTGNQCWTLFLNSKIFKGPVAFYTPATWSRISRIHPPAVGRGLDARPGLVTGGAIEINTVPRLTSQDADGKSYARIPRLQFPADRTGRTILLHNLTHYSKLALYDQVRDWLAGGSEASGRFEQKGASIPACTARPLSVRQGEDNQAIAGCESFVETKAFDRTTFGLQWKPSALEPWTKNFQKGVFPEYFRKEGNTLAAVDAKSVPSETRLAVSSFSEPVSDALYTSPHEPSTVWSKPGPKSGPYKVRLTDGSVVTYCWYRFIDQPALQDADLTIFEKRRLQTIAEKIHRQWTTEKEYMAPPAIGALATLDASLIVKPPKGLEVGYVPIVTDQSPAATPSSR